MKNLIIQGKSHAVRAKGIKESECGKLYVAYLNRGLIDNADRGDNFTSNNENSSRNGKTSVFSTTGGSYYINGVPAILSQDEEAMLYGDEYSEYY